MSSSKRYFQLTSDILLEYNYASLDNAKEQEKTNEYVRDLYENGTMLATCIKSDYNSSYNFLYNPYLSNFVLPTNKSESKFIQCSNLIDEKIWNSPLLISDCGILNMNTDNTSDILIDKFKLHFTGRNYMGDYDGFILRITLYDKLKNKVCLMSNYIRKTDFISLNENPMLVNQKLYTSYMEYEIPSTDGLLNAGNLMPGENELRNALCPSYDLMDSTPISFSIYGVKTTTETYGYELYTVEKINTIFVPFRDKFNNIELNVKESNDGDYFEIYPKINDSIVSFSDYIYKISDGRPEIYIIFYDLTLTEYYVDSLKQTKPRITHREQYILNASIMNSENDMEINEYELDKHMIYRPVITSGNTVSFDITVQMKILNTLDNTTIIKTGSLNYGLDSEGKENPKKYGKKLNKIYLGEIPSTVKVYNKKLDIDTDRINITNSNSNIKIENHQHSIIGFIETANVGVSIEQIPIDQL